MLKFSLYKDYLSNTKKLCETKIVRSGMSGNLNFKYDKDKGTSFEVNLPEEDSILSLLHRMRQFILNDEYSSYNKVTGIIARRFNHKSINSIIKKQRNLYDGKEFQGLIKIESNGRLINSEKVLFDWLNAFEYHTDQTKKQEIEELHKLMPLEASRAIFLMLITEKVKAIINIADFIALLVGEIEVIELKAKVT